LKLRAPLTRLAEFILGLAEGKTRGLATLSPEGRGEYFEAGREDLLAFLRERPHLGTNDERCARLRFPAPMFAES